MKKASGGGGCGGYRQECLFIENDEMTTAVKALRSTDFDIREELRNLVLRTNFYNFGYIGCVSCLTSLLEF